MNSDGCAGAKKHGVEPWVQNSRLIGRWQEIKREIELHKWYESEKAGHDIGWECAAASWQVRYGHLLGEESRH